MASNMYLYEKARQAHDQNLLCEAEKQRVLAHLPRPHRRTIRRAIGKLGVLLLKLGAWLKQMEQSDGTLVDHG